MNSQAGGPVGPTLLSAIQRFKSNDFLQSHANHLFSSSFSESANELQELLHATDQLSHSLNVHSSTSFSNPKLISMLRQEATISHTLHLSDQNIRQTVTALRTRSGASYGEDVPTDRSLVADWAISRLEACGNLVGMETFKEDLEREGRMTFVLGGKVLVIDIELSVDRTLLLGPPRITLNSLKTSYAVPNGAPADGSVTANTEGSASLDAILTSSVGSFLDEVQKETDLLDAMEAERLGKGLADQLRYLMMLDKVAANKEEEGGGMRWFVDVDELGANSEKFASSEADAIASALSLPSAPLDIYLNRSHGLPLPYLTSPSLSFLVHLTPLAYLTTLRAVPGISSVPPPNLNLPKLDVPLTHLRQFLTGHPPPKGATVATLTLEPCILSAYPLSLTGPYGAHTDRPTFSFAQPDDKRIFPQIHPQEQVVASAHETYAWTLDFTSSGKSPGVVISQSRMRQIERVLYPAASVDSMSDIGLISFGTGSRDRDWVDMLLAMPEVSQGASAPKKYTTLYRSPSSAHPPLRLRLTPPEEPGFLLEKARVKNMHEVWGVIEVVKEQCWINALLTSSEWTTANSAASQSQETPAADPVSEEVLEALLKGTHIPNEIPVELFFPSTSNSNFPSVSELGFDISDTVPTHNREPPKLTMTLPERPPLTGFTEVIVSYDQMKVNGVKVEVGGRMGMEGSGIDIEVLEEVCRRGGALGLAGRVWKGSDTMVI
ncbi:hypothetical protein FIBSPDRAFT_809370 [Athelia psychrophila]|uniref:Mediator complex subunit 1 n=1 Tax=Athelia psychrophila TaxID=1759441 RepID=A0A166WZB6_9AGAM|nr:hypothetical protein FIBSPDRAFT_809370 [Fibularhizoctonia sp. CBS 109695]